MPSRRTRPSTQMPLLVLPQVCKYWSWAGSMFCAWVDVPSGTGGGPYARSLVTFSRERESNAPAGGKRR